MQLYTLNPSTFLRDKLIQNWSSVIWSERYNMPGDYELHSPDIEYLLALLPPGTLVFNDESQEVMITESQEIKNASGDVEIVIKGRTFETILEQRTVQNNAGHTSLSGVFATSNTYTTLSRMAQLVAEAVLTHSTINAERIPGLRISISDAALSAAAQGTDQNFNYSEVYEDAYKTVMDCLAPLSGGIRNQVPQPGFIDDLLMAFYAGVDRSQNQTARDPVVFDYSSGHLEGPRYFFSNKDYKNVCYVRSPLGFVTVGFGTGFNRRAMYVNATDLTDPGQGTAYQALYARGLRELAQKNRTDVFEAEASQIIPYKYGTHYGLGDKITVKGQYGITRTMMVTEYIRSESEQGIRGYPSLAMV